MWVPLTYQLIMEISSEISIAQVIFSLECGIVDIFTSIKSLFLWFVKREKCFSLNHNFLWSTRRVGNISYKHVSEFCGTTLCKYSWTSPQRPPWGKKKVAVVEVAFIGGSTVKMKSIMVCSVSQEHILFACKLFAWLLKLSKLSCISWCKGRLKRDWKQQTFSLVLKDLWVRAVC